jgi:hypothetical protein
LINTLFLGLFISLFIRFLQLHLRLHFILLCFCFWTDAQMTSKCGDNNKSSLRNEANKWSNLAVILTKFRTWTKRDRWWRYPWVYYLIKHGSQPIRARARVRAIYPWNKTKKVLSNSLYFVTKSGYHSTRTVLSLLQLVKCTWKC